MRQVLVLMRLPREQVTPPSLKEPGLGLLAFEFEFLVRKMVASKASLVLVEGRGVGENWVARAVAFRE
jgi:hypothetical protein